MIANESRRNRLFFQVFANKFIEKSSGRPRRRAVDIICHTELI